MMRSNGRLQALNILLTISLGLAALTLPMKSWSAPNPTQPDLQEKPGDQTSATPEEIERAKLVHPTAPPPLSKRIQEADYFFRYRRSITVRTGLEVALNETNNPGPVLSLLHWFPLADLRGVEVGADLGRDGNGTLHAAYRHMLGNERLRYFYKLGAGIRIVAKDQLVTFLRLRNWQARASGGLEWTVSDPLSLRADIDGILTSETPIIQMTVGLAMAW